MKVLAVTSGKGGVGKSTFSLNIARQLSLSGLTTLLVDFDIHNQGVTGLFMESIKPDATSLTSLISANQEFSLQVASEQGASVHLTHIPRCKNLFVLPAALPDEAVNWSDLHSQTCIDMAACFRALFTSIAEANKIDTILIDCYGGIDSMTISAGGFADDLIIVNEPDLVTFTGTLKLYTHLKETYAESPHLANIHFIINRISSRYSYTFLRDLYRENLAEYSVDNHVLAYFPYDRLVIETFGEFPFFSELLPRSLFTRKIRLLIGTLWGKDPAFRRFPNPATRHSRKIFRQTSEYFFAEPERIIRTFIRAPFLFTIPVLFFTLIVEGIGGPLNRLTIYVIVYACAFFAAFTILFISIFQPIQVTRWLLREARYRQRKRRFLSRVTPVLRWFNNALSYGQALLPLVFGFVLFYSIAAISIFITKDYLEKVPHGNVLAIWPGGVSGFHHGKPGALRNYRETNLNPTSWIVEDDLSYIDFSGSDFRSFRISDVDLTGADFSSSAMSESERRMADITPNSSKVRVTLLTQTVFTTSKLNETKFDNTNLAYVHFDKSTLDQASFRSTTINHVHFWNGVSLRDANFDDADIGEIDLRGAILTGADFTKVRGMSTFDRWYVEMNGGKADAARYPIEKLLAQEISQDAFIRLGREDPRASSLLVMERDALGTQVWDSVGKGILYDLHIDLISPEKSTFSAARAWRKWRVATPGPLSKQFLKEAEKFLHLDSPVSGDIAKKIAALRASFSGDFTNFDKEFPPRPEKEVEDESVPDPSMSANPAAYR